MTIVAIIFFIMGVASALEEPATITAVTQCASTDGPCVDKQCQTIRQHAVITTSGEYRCSGNEPDD